ncbi:MAG: DNA polymerase III subunit delta [bacterium]|jgi:DNA polymerase-3 subunit delta
MNFRAVWQEMQKEQGKRIFLDCGPDDFFREEALAQLRQVLLNPDYAIYNYSVLDGKTAGPNEIVEVASTMPFLDNYRLVVVRDPIFLAGANNKKVNSTDSRRNDGFLSYLREPMPSTCLVLTAPAADRRLALFKAISRAGMVFSAAAAGEKEIVAWAVHKAKTVGKTIDSGALRLLIEYTARDVRLLGQELEKLFNYLGDRTAIKKDDVLAVASRLPENNAFTLIDNIAQRRKDTALGQLREILRGGEPPYRLLGLLISQVRLILEGKILQEHGNTPQQIAGQLGAHPFRIQKSLAQGKRYTTEELRRMLQLLLQTDEALKRGKSDPHLALELFVLQAGNK